jgi:hypothetical protein
MAMKTTGRATKTRGGDGKFVKSLDTAERDGQAARLRTRGLGFDQIATELGFASRGHAHNAVTRALLATLQEPADELRQLECERLDDLIRHAQRVLVSRHLQVSASGKVATDPATGEPLRDWAPVIAAIRELRQLSESRRKLLGLDAPTQARVEVITEDMINAEIVRLEAVVASEQERAAALAIEG